MWNIPNEKCTYMGQVKWDKDKFWPCYHDENASKKCKYESCPIKIRPETWGCKHGDTCVVPGESTCTPNCSEYESEVECNHNWVTMDNEIITGGEMCTKCHAIRPT